MYEILNTSSNKWNQYLDNFKLNGKDIYFTSDYYKLYESNGDGVGKCFVYKDNNKNLALYPFMLNEVKKYDLKDKYYDIETAYGYGGPILNCSDIKFKTDFEKAFLDYCNKSNIVAEFIRFHPLINNENVFSNNIEVIHNRKTVYINLFNDKAIIWNEDIKSKNRNMIRKAKKNGLIVEKSRDFENFKYIYDCTMNKVNADEYYYFNDKYYENIKENSNCFLFDVKKEEKVIASAIFMGYGNYFHYHLSGSIKEYLKYAPNNILLWEAIKYAQKNGYKKMHLGGGITDSLEDQLFKFKSGFSKEYSDFYIGKRVHNRGIYNYLIRNWEEKHNKKANILLQYRAK